MTGGNESQLFASMFASHDKTKFAPSDAHMRVALALRALELARVPCRDAAVTAHSGAFAGKAGRLPFIRC